MRQTLPPLTNQSSVGNTAGTITASLAGVCLALLAATVNAVTLPIPASEFPTQLQISNTSNAGHELQIHSQQDADIGSVDIYLALDLPYQRLADFFAAPQRWCDALILHVYIKSCVYPGSGPNSLYVYLGTKQYDLPEDVYRFDYRIQPGNSNASGLLIDLFAEHGPLGSTDYVLRFAAIPSGNGSIVRFYYRARYGFLARTAFATYLNTLGRSKRGFSREGPTQEPIKGIRGILERNAMRYLLAIAAYLHNEPIGADIAQLIPALKYWHHYTMQYQEQLYDIDWPVYEEMKRKEYENQMLLRKDAK